MKEMNREEILVCIRFLAEEISTNEEENRIMEDEIEALYNKVDEIST